MPTFVDKNAYHHHDSVYSFRLSKCQQTDYFFKNRKKAMIKEGCDVGIFVS